MTLNMIFSDWDAKAAHKFCQCVMEGVVYSGLSEESDRGDFQLMHMMHDRNFSAKELKAISARQKALLTPCW